MTVFSLSFSRSVGMAIGFTWKPYPISGSLSDCSELLSHEDSWDFKATSPMLNISFSNLYSLFIFIMESWIEKSHLLVKSCSLLWSCNRCSGIVDLSAPRTPSPFQNMPSSPTHRPIYDHYFLSISGSNSYRLRMDCRNGVIFDIQFWHIIVVETLSPVQGFSETCLYESWWMHRDLSCWYHDPHWQLMALLQFYVKVEFLCFVISVRWIFQLSVYLE